MSRATHPHPKPAPEREGLFFKPFAALGGMGVVFVCVAASAGAQIYRWTDERGVTAYGSKPPRGVPAQLVDAQPHGPVHLSPEQQKQLEADARRRADLQPPAAAPAPPLAVAPPVRGMAFDTYIRLERGMSEGELLLRAGQPDQVALDASDDGGVAKSYYYLPTGADPFITVVTLRRGRIAHLERTRKF